MIILCVVAAVFIASLVYELKFNRYDDAWAIVISFISGMVLFFVGCSLLFQPSTNVENFYSLQLMRPNLAVLAAQEPYNPETMKLVNDYNKQVLMIRYDSKAWITRDYYPNDIDWESLETIGKVK